MIGFSYKNLLLQLIHGSVIVITFLFLKVDCIKLDNYFISHNSITILLFLFLAFLIGFVIDFLADILESIIIKFVINPPAFYLLTREKWFGIALAHNDFILKELFRIAVKYGNNAETEKSYQNGFIRPDKKIVNYILQVAKNKAFRVCKDYQKEQIDSFFILYIFSRNISLSLLISAITLFLFASNIVLPKVLLFLTLLTLASSYRYYLYYARILLGTTIQEEKSEKQ